MPEASELSELPFGRKACDQTGYEACWVQFKTSGYPRKLRREWDAAQGDGDKIWAIIRRYVDDWNIVDLDGQPVRPAPDMPAGVVDNVEDAVVTWLTRAFIGFWLTEVTLPRPNLSRPLATTPTA